MLKERVVLGVAVVAACLLTATGAAAAPAINLIRPAEGQRFVVGEIVTADYLCDGANPVTCTGDVPGGAPIDTSTPGDFTFTVDATDANGAASVVHHYTVAPQACADDDVEAPYDRPAVITVSCPRPGGTITATDPPNGEVTVTGDREITYEPDGGFTGSDSFTYTVTENGVESGPATIDLEVAVAGCDDVPAQTMTRNAVLAISPTCTGTFDDVVAAHPTEGAVDVDPEDGDLLYTAPDDFVGTASFGFCANDTDSGCASPEVIVDVEVGPCADTVASGTALAPISVPLDCVLPDDDPDATVVVTNDNPGESVTGTPGDTSVSYFWKQPAGGQGTLTYFVRSIHGDSIPATATVDVGPYSGGGGNGGGGDDGGGSGGGGGGGGGGLVPDEPDAPGPGLPPLPRLPSLDPAGPGSGNIPTEFGKQTGITLRDRTLRANGRGRFGLKLRNVNAFAVVGTLTVTGAYEKNRKGKRVPRLRVRDPELLLAAGKTTTVTLRLDRAARRLLARKGKLKLLAELRVRDVEGGRRTVRQRFTLRAP